MKDDLIKKVDVAKKPIEVLASKGILKGTSETEYAPQNKYHKGRLPLLPGKDRGGTLSLCPPYRFDCNTTASYHFNVFKFTSQQINHIIVLILRLNALK